LGNLESQTRGSLAAADLADEGTDHSWAATCDLCRYDEGKDWTMSRNYFNLMMLRRLPESIDVGRWS
jgi:hypothetical protein